MIPIIVLILGISSGITFGSKFGHAGAWIGGMTGAVIGLLCWFSFVNFLTRLDQNRNASKPSKKTIEQLRKKLNNPKCKNPNEVLLELGIKGEKMENYLPIILRFMVSPLMETRRQGWFTLATVFPERAKMIPDYQFFESAEKCKEKVQKLILVQI